MKLATEYQKGLFASLPLLITIENANLLNTSDVTNMEGIFSSTKKLINLDISA